MSTRLLDLIQDRYNDLLIMWHNHKNPPVIYPPFRLDDDLSGMTIDEIDREEQVIKKRLEQGMTEPEGPTGLNYRLHRLKAQAVVVKRKNIP